MNNDLLSRITAGLELADVRYMVVGSFASTFHGEPRTTHDIDFVVDATIDSIQLFAKSLGPDRFSMDDAVLAVANRDMFNVIDSKSGWKADLIVCKSRPFSQIELDRRQPALIGGVQTFVATAEDTILTKLEWQNLPGSERQLRDAVNVLDVASDRLDNDYLNHWAPELGVEASLSKATQLVAGSQD